MKALRMLRFKLFLVAPRKSSGQPLSYRLATF